VVRDLAPSLTNLYPKLYKWHNSQHIYVPGRYLVLQIPKTGSTFINKSLIQQRSMDKFKEIYRHEGAGEWIRNIGVEEWLRITTVAVVRNPFDLLLSFYFHQRKHNEIPKDWDFDRAVRELVSKRNPHVYQHPHICNGNNRIIVKHVFKYEQGLGEIMRQLEVLGIKPIKRIDSRVMVNPSPGKPLRNQISRYLTNSAVALIQREFARDFELLGYSMDPDQVGKKELKGVVGGVKQLEAQSSSS
jgi:hypothetical protein